MSFVLTFVAADYHASPLLEQYFENYGQGHWLSEAKAADVFVDEALSKDALDSLRDGLDAHAIDVFMCPVEGRRKRLLLADMDSTIVAEETLDELAAFAGLKDQVAEITAKAMNGELDFHGAIRERVGLLKGLATTALDETLAETIVNPGAKTLVKTMKAHGATCVLVSGGFTFFTSAIAKDVGFDHNHGNTLGIEGDALTGLVIEPILDKHAKVHFLDHYTGDLGIDALDAMTIGDGANDLPMLQKAGLGVGYKPKPTVAAEVTNVIRHGDLSTALYAQGYSQEEIQQFG